jgi:4-amino-4-deoxy-L-arabinose transferase-like glycosyltransferase
MIGSEKILLTILGALIVSFILNIFDNILLMGFIFCALLAFCTSLFLVKVKVMNKGLFLLFSLIFLFHIIIVLFVYYANFQPFGNGLGDFVGYDQNAKIIYSRLHNGDFSVGGLESTSHYYAVLLGYIYFFTAPSMLIGQLFNAWLSALISVLAYFIVIEIFGKNKYALLVGVIVALYPSLLFFGSLLLKDALITFLSLVAVLLIIKLIKNFSYGFFAIFYLISGLIFHFRFYIGFAVIFTFVISWLIFYNFDIKKKFIYVLIFIALFGFLPQVFMIDRAGYWGNILFKQYLNQKTISYYRNVAYAPEPQYVKEPENKPSQLENNFSENQDTSGSTFNIDTNFKNPLNFIRGYSLSFVYSVLSPLPWQIKYKRQLYAFAETIPWYILLFFIIKGLIINFKRYYKKITPLLIFSFLILGNIALFINNFGIITRIRIPAVICLLCLLPFGIEGRNIFYDCTKKIYINFKKWKQK